MDYTVDMWLAKLTVQIEFNRLIFCFIRLAESRSFKSGEKYWAFERKLCHALSIKNNGSLKLKNESSYPSIPKFKRLAEEAWLEFGLKVKRLSLSSPMSLSSSNGIGLEKLWNCFKRG
ncbi:unnamed protein product [Arabidopsis thaliana]|uniref:Uncharacterized protein n=1 Tax=Arabidopsis thaliana TaxID=3702 RepID=A0A654FP08_ARATH|nr:unnamed protein product [Arabidopsis thaliana]